jgi:hypothetical protein
MTLVPGKKWEFNLLLLLRFVLRRERWLPRLPQPVIFESSKTSING